MVNFQGSILDSLLANYVKAHSHIIYIFCVSQKQHCFCVWIEKNEEYIFIELVFRFVLHSFALNKQFVVLTSVSFFTPNVREVLEVIFCTNAILKKSFHNIIVKMSKLARLHGVKKKEVCGKLEVYDISLTWNALNKVWTNFWRKKIKFV